MSKTRKHNKKNMRKKRTKNKTKKYRRVYTSKEYKSNDGMLTTVWGPPLWHYLHTMSFNYPVNPTIEDKKHYREFICSLKYVLPCGKCRKNFYKNLKDVPLNAHAMKNRANFSKWVYRLHEHINKMLNKNSGLTYDDVRERYEHFRARCTDDNKNIKLNGGKTGKTGKSKKTKKTKTKRKTKKHKEDGCVEPLYGKKSKCVLNIVPKETKVPSLTVDKKCIKKRN